MITWLLGLWILVPALLRKIIIIGGVSMIALSAAYVKGRADCSANWKLAEAKAEAAHLAKIVKDTEAVAAESRKRAEESAARLSQLNQSLEELRAHAANLNNSCLDADAAGRVRNLWRK